MSYTAAPSIVLSSQRCRICVPPASIILPLQTLLRTEYQEDYRLKEALNIKRAYRASNGVGQVLETMKGKLSTLQFIYWKAQHQAQSGKNSDEEAFVDPDSEE